MSSLRLHWILVLLLLGPGKAVDIPFVFVGNFSDVTNCSSDQLGRISAMSTDLIGVPVLYEPPNNEVVSVSDTSKDNGPVNRLIWPIVKLKKAFDSRIEPDNDYIRHKVKTLAVKYPGDHNIDQICSIYQYLEDGDTSTKGWSYVSGPRDIHIPSYPNDTLEVAEGAGCSGTGDCNDFAVLMSTLIESIGGTTRVILAYNRGMNEGHAYAEVYLGKLNAQDSEVEDIIKWLMQRYATDRVFTHINSTTKDVWLNLDWGSEEPPAAAHPGGPFYKGDTDIVLDIREEFYKTSLKVSIDQRLIDAEKRNDYSLSLFRNGMYDKAIQASDSAIQIDPKNTLAWCNKGNALYELGRYAESLQCFDEAIGIDKKYVDAWSNKGWLLFNTGSYEKAVQCFDNATEIDPSDALTWNGKGLSLYNLKKYEEAISAYNKSIELNPKYANAWDNKGWTLFDMGRYGNGLQYFDKAIDLNSSDEEAWLGKGIGLYNLKRYEESIGAYDKAIELDPKYGNAWGNKGWTLFDMGEYENSLQCFDKAIEINSSDAIAWHGKDLSLRLLGRIKEADAASSKATDLGYKS
jgi:tetratricopeptide (TPR) repeat protein